YSDLLNTTTLPTKEQTLATGIAAQVRRTRTLVASLLTFVRQAPAHMSAVDVNSVLQTGLRLLAPQLDFHEARFHLDLSSPLPAVYGQSKQLLHVFLHRSRQIGGHIDPESKSNLRVQTRHENDTVAIEFSSDLAGSSVQYQPLQSSIPGSLPSTLSLGA